MMKAPRNPADFIPQKSETYLAGEPVVFAIFNDVHFFVEDQDCENLYHELLTKFFPELNIAKIFSYNGKDTVIREARKNREKLRVHVYIVDQDFDGLLGSKEELRGLFHLKRFCVENYLLEEDAFLAALVVMNPKTKKNDLRESFSFDRRLNDYILSFRELYALFAIIREYRLNLPTVGNNYRRYLEAGNSCAPDSVKISALRTQLKRELSSRLPTFDDKIDHYERLIGAEDVHISGKHILDAFLELSIAMFKTKKPLIRESLSMLLAQRCALSSLQPFIDEVRIYILEEKRKISEKRGAQGRQPNG